MASFSVSNRLFIPSILMDELQSLLLTSPPVSRVAMSHSATRRQKCVIFCWLWSGFIAPPFQSFLYGNGRGASTPGSLTPYSIHKKVVACHRREGCQSEASSSRRRAAHAAPRRDSGY